MVKQIVNCSHMKRAAATHELSLIAIYSPLFQMIKKEIVTFPLDLAGTLKIV